MYQTIPNSHSWMSLEGILVGIKINRKEMTKDYIITGLNNCIKRGYSLERIKETDNKIGCHFGTIEGIITYLNNNEPFNYSDFTMLLEDTIREGYNLKCERKMERREVYQHIDIEREYQDLRWDYDGRGNDIPDREKQPAEWLNYMEFHLSKAKTNNYNHDKDGTLDEIRKVVALGVRALEIHGCPERIIPVELTKIKNNGC